MGSIVGPFSPSTPDVYIVKSTGKLPADMSQLAAAREGIVTDLKKKKSNEADTLFKDSILSRLEKDGKVKLHNDVIKRLIASNRG